MSYYLSSTDGKPLPWLGHEAKATEGHILLLTCDKEGDGELFSAVLAEVVRVYGLEKAPRVFTQPPFGETWSFIYTTSQVIIPFDLHQFYQDRGLVAVKKVAKFEPFILKPELKIDQLLKVASNWSTNIKLKVKIEFMRTRNNSLLYEVTCNDCLDLLISTLFITFSE